MMALQQRLRTTKPAQSPPMTAAAREAMERMIADPDIGSIKRRALSRKLAGVVAVGPTDLRNPSPPPEPPTRAGVVVAAQRSNAVQREHAKIVAAEIAAVEARTKIIEERLAGLGKEDRSYQGQELRAERRQLDQLRRDLEADRDQGPITHGLDGKEVTDRIRAIVALRAKELASLHWAAAERDAAAGDHREARRHRIDSLRSRILAEDEMKLRPTVAGFGICGWS